MKLLRQLAIVIVAAVLVGASLLWTGNVGQKVEITERGDKTVHADASSATWFCASQGEVGALAHELHLANAGDIDSVVTVRALGSEGEHDFLVTTVGAHTTERLNIAREFESAEFSLVIEARPGSLGVEHTIAGEQGTSTQPCVDAADSNWYFMNQRTTLGVQHELFIMNPFATDAGVDVAVAAQDGVRFPTEAQGLVIPAHSVRRVDLAEIGGRWEDAAISVTARTGRVVAETLMTFDGGEHVNGQSGVQITVGVTHGQTAWNIPVAFSGTETLETMMVFNPSEDDTQVTAQVVPFGASDLLPEPFTLNVAPGRFGIVQLAAEARISGVGYHSVVVESDNDVPFVVGVSQSILASTDEETLAAAAEAGVANRPNVDGGRTQRTMNAQPSLAWLVPRVAPGPQDSMWLAITNPHNEIVRVAVTTSAGEQVMDNVELGAHDATVIPLNVGTYPEPEVLAVLADLEIYVTRIQARTLGLGDISLVSALPLTLHEP